MKKIFLTLVIVFCIINADSQTRERDSLKQLITNDKEDTSRVLHLADLSFKYLESKPDTTMTLALEALSLARRIGFVKGEAESLNRVGNAYNVLGNYPKALEVFLQALKINEKINNLDGRSKNLNNIGLLYSELEDYRQSLEYYFKAKDLSEKINNKESISTNLVNIGESYYYLKIFDSARLYIQQSYNVADRINYFRTMSNSSRIMGNIYSETGQYNLALDYYRAGIPYSIESNNYLNVSDTYLGMAKVFEKIKQNDSVVFYAKQSLRIAREKRFTEEVRDGGRFLSFYYRIKRNADSAFFYQDVARAANDSLFNRQKLRQFQGLSFDEKLRQQDIAAAELKADEERKINLQYAAIAIGLITFIVFFLVLSRTIFVKEKFIEFFGILGILAMFEFINLYIQPYLAHFTNNSPVLMLFILVGIAALLVRIHHRLEKWISKIIVEKNKKIRLMAAKKTIEKLESKNSSH